MSTLYEYYNTGDDAYGSVYDIYWGGQTFTPVVAHKITSVKLKLYRVGSPGTVTVSIKATDGDGHPTGADLCSGTIDGDTFTTDTDGAWYEITLGAGYDLDADTKYAIVIRALNGNSSNLVRWRKDASSPAYAGGNAEYSLNSGSSWNVDTADRMFEDWGEPLATEKTSSDTGSGVDAVDSLQTPQAKTSSDTGSGVEGASLAGASLAGSETGSGIEALILRLLAAFDAGGGVEASSVETDGLFKDLFATELGEGSDLLTAKIEMPTKGGGMKLWT